MISFALDYWCVRLAALHAWRQTRTQIEKARSEGHLLLGEPTYICAFVCVCIRYLSKARVAVSSVWLSFVA